MNLKSNPRRRLEPTSLPGLAATMSLVLVTLGGCVLPIPHTTERSPEVTGTVLDARRHTPVQGAKAFLTDHPEVSAVTDENGRFRIKKTHNFRLLWIGFGHAAHWPNDGKFWSVGITVSHQGYATYVQSGLEDGRFSDKGEILLQPQTMRGVFQIPHPPTVRLLASGALGPTVGRSDLQVGRMSPCVAAGTSIRLKPST